MIGRIDRDELGLLLARAWSMRGTCARRRVGCVLVDASGFVLSSGYNGPAAEEPHCVDAACPGAAAPSGTALEACEAIHAEQNSLLRCADVGLIRTCYATHSPCLHCVKLLMNTGCRRIAFAEPYAHDAASRALWERAGRAWDHLPELLRIVDERDGGS